MSEVENSTLRLARALVAATNAGKIDWQRETDTSFSYSGNGSSVVIRSEEQDGQSPYQLLVLDNVGVVIESVSSHGKPDHWGEREAKPWEDVYSELYAGARRKALNIDEVISSLLDAIKDEPLDAIKDEPPF